MTIPVIEHHVDPQGSQEYYRLGKSERPDCWCFRLRTLRHFLVDLDETGRIHSLSWLLPPEPLRPEFVRLFDDPDNYPFWLLRQDAEPIWVPAPSAILAGAKGAAIKTKTEVLWVPAEQLIGAAIRLMDEPGNALAPAPAVEATNDVTK